jgi:cytochrome c oxidase cbb3-type subunit 2
MNSGPTLFLGLFLAMAISWLAFVLEPQVQIGNLQQTNTVAVGALPVAYPNNLPGDAHEGAQAYRANGCAACHTQQVRPDTDGCDLARGWGRRRSVAEDYIYDQPVMLGSQRIGPDLANAGMRMDAHSVLVRLYNPRALPGSGASIMPPYPYLFEQRKVRGMPAPDALELPPAFAPQAGYEIVPGRQARALASYVLNLRQEGYLFEAPPPEAKTNAPANPASTNAAPANPASPGATNAVAK